MFVKGALTIFTFMCVAVNMRNSGCVCICVAMVIGELHRVCTVFSVLCDVQSLLCNYVCERKMGMKRQTKAEFVCPNMCA